MKVPVKQFIALLGANLLGAAPAFAHAADQGFVLLLPTDIYITGGALAVAATILLMFALRPGVLMGAMAPRKLAAHNVDWRQADWVSVLASGLLAVLIIIGLQGPTDPQANLLPLVLWTIWWMLLFVVQSLVFDVWSFINPWPGLHRLLLPNDREPFRLPARLSIWPAVVFMVAFQGFVLADVAPNDPRRLASFALGYWIFTLAGMTAFGRDAWLRQVECFTVLFNMLGKLRAIGTTTHLMVGMPGWQMFETPRFDLSHAAFVIVVLAAGSFDGLYETFWWLGQIGVNPLEYPGRTALITSTVIGLYGGIVLLALVFAAAVLIGFAFIKGDVSVSFRDLFVAFSLTLLPIAVGYHLSHYLVTFIVQIQVVAATLADPLARGWNLFWLGDTRVMVGFLTVPATVRVIWLTQAGVVVLSHIWAVILSHRTAEVFCTTRRRVLQVQFGISILMIFYTIFGLWLLASPRGA